MGESTAGALLLSMVVVISGSIFSPMLARIPSITDSCILFICPEARWGKISPFENGLNHPLSTVRIQSTRGVQQLIYCTSYPQCLLDVPACGVRECGVEEFRVNLGVVDELQNPGVLHALISLPDAAEDLTEPRRYFLDEVFDVWFEVTIEDDCEQNPGVVIEQENAEVVDRADSVFPIRGLGLELRETFAENLRSSRRNLANAGELASLPDPSAGTVRLTGHLLGQCGTFIVDRFRQHWSPLLSQL